MGLNLALSARCGNRIEAAGIQIHIGLISDGFHNFHCALDGFTFEMILRRFEIFRPDADNSAFFFVIGKLFGFFGRQRDAHIAGLKEDRIVTFLLSRI